jgi:L-lactate dehydrogenase
LSDQAMTSVVIRRSHHIACLQAYLQPVTDAGLFVLLTCSDPGNRWVAPTGATSRVYSPDPVAAGIPTDGEPILVDVSMSTTAFGQVARAGRRGERLAGPWLVDAAGNPSDDPRPLLEKPPVGALLPLGGADHGHKGFGLGLIVEALTSALAGHGRADGDARWGSSVFLLLIDPGRFGGREAFVRETSFLAAACRAAEVPPGRPRVRLPGEGALARRREQRAHGVALDAGIMPALQPWAEKLQVAVPAPRT